MKSVKISALWKVFVSAAVAALFVACDKTDPAPEPTPTPEPDPTPVVVPDPEPAEGISNQFQYNSASLIDIKSVIYVDNEEEEFGELYLSPVEGLDGVEAVLATDDYLYIKAPFLDGDQTLVDTTKTFELSYKDLHVTDQTLTGKEHKVRISISQDSPVTKTEWDKALIDGVVISVDYINDANEYLFARYTGSVLGCYPLAELNNQYTINEEETIDLNSAVFVRYEEYGLDYVFFYAEEGITDYDEDNDYVLVVAVPQGETGFNFAEVEEGEGYAFMAEGWGEGKTGKVEFTVENGKLTLNADGEDSEENTIRVRYSGAVACTYMCDNEFYQPDYSSVELFDVFRETYGTASYYFAFGSNFNAETPEELKNGKYALFLEVPQSAVDAPVDEDNFTFPEGFKAYLYDYENYTTYEWSIDDADDWSRIVVKSDANGTDKKVYIRYDLIFLDAEGEEINVYMTAYLNIIDTTIPDLTPVKPFSPKITITSESGETLLDWDITEMQVRHQPAYGDISDFMGTKPSAYAFYFVNKNTESNGIDSQTGTPIFILEDTNVNKLDNTQLNGSTSVVWATRFQNSNLSSYSGYGHDINAEKLMTWRCPDDVKLTVKKDGKNWTFKLVLKDYGAMGSSWTGLAPTTMTGTKNVLTIEWQGPATKYTGSNKNDLTDEDY